MKGIVTSELNRRFAVIPQTQAMYSMVTALCISTIDPWKEGAVQFYSPLIFDADSTVSSLPWAWPVSSMGGFDDCGCTWVPPAGSMLCILFENGHRAAPFYIGTVWSRNRGPMGNHTFGFPVPEYDNISDTHRGGYLLPPNDESQVFMPWNTETYNGKDINMIGQYEDDPTAQKKITASNIYGIKTPEKHMIKMVDGDANCDRRWKRFEIQSGTGNWMIFKDDHIHPSGQWANPACGCGGGDESSCSAMQDPETTCQSPQNQNKCANPYFKHQNECRPYKGPQTPQNNTADLNQSGIQFLTVSGISLVMDDSVDQPRGSPIWERSTQAFDFGCNNKYTGKFYVKTALGHGFTMSDMDSDTNIRSEKNYIQLKSAAGNRVELNDHTVPGANGSTVAGEQRGITIQSTSDNQIVLCDNGNTQPTPNRKEGGVPNNLATNAYIMIRTGYGLMIKMSDNQSQTKTQPDPSQDGQSIVVLSPQKDNTKRGYHQFSMHEVKEGPGMIFLRAGGYYIINTFDDIQTTVGTSDNDANQYTQVFGKIMSTGKFQAHFSDTQYVIRAGDQILLLAGNDCDTTVYNPDGTVKEVIPKSQPCCYQVVINRNACYCPIVTWMGHFTPGLSTSERVFASGYSAADTIGSGPCGD